MKIKCPYCDTMFDDTLMNCPNCGAASEGVARTESKQPITIEQLQQWYSDRGLPPYETTRFFIGVNHTGPKAFGIYRDASTGNFVVYKNLANGDRKVRYEGTDEAYAVNELYMRLKEEIIQQKRNSVGNGNGTGGSNGAAASGSTGKNTNQKKKPLMIALVIAIILLFTAVDFFSSDDSSTTSYDDVPYIGYYLYDDVNYYHAARDTDTDDWYYYDTDTDSWEHTYATLPDDLNDKAVADDFYYTPTWDSTTQANDFDAITPFDESEYASQYASDTTTDSWDNNDDDTDYDWDTGTDTWDNDTTDWGDDW